MLGLALLAGCSTTQEITVDAQASAKPIHSIAQVARDGNSVQMDGLLQAALIKEQLAVKGTPLPPGIQTAADVDALVSYVDVWRWDLVMYLRQLTIQLHDAASEQLLAQGQWTNSPLHGFQDARTVMEGLVSNLMARVRDARAALSATANKP